MGIDPSIRSTGICIKDGDTYRYYNIASKPTKKLQSLQLERFKLLTYKYLEQTDKTSIGKEVVKGWNVYCIAHQIEELIFIYKPEYVVLEAVAFAATGTIDQLAGLNYCIRCACYMNNIPVYTIPPTSVKLEFVGNGQATKEDMIKAWSMLEPISSKLIEYKCDDLADAYALVNFPKEKIIIQKK